MYINLKWLKNNYIIQEFMKYVINSNCIYSNRWGDLSLWGVALILSQQPQQYLKIPYYHGSHRTSVLLNNKLIHYV